MPFDRIARAIAAAPSTQGYLGVTTEAGERDYLLGPRSEPRATPPLLDWRTAPLAEAFFRYGPGEAYEVAVGDRGIAGRVRARYIVQRPGDALLGETELVTHEGEAWHVEPRPRPAPAAGPVREHVLLPVLDADQQRVVELPPGTSVIVDGEAGVGKTLVALYRMASLAERATGRWRGLVLVPTEGLRRLCRLLADRLAIPHLEIAVTDDWLIERARRAFPGMPSRLAESASAATIALKRHPAVRVVLPDFVGWRPPSSDDRISRPRQRLLHLWGDRDRLDKIAAGTTLPARAITETMAHTRLQFEQTTEAANRHVDADRLDALAGRRLDDGTPMQDAHTIDAEDIPVLFELARIGALRINRDADLERYEHVAIDEAQLRSPLELAAIGDAVAPGGSVTLAGDHRQATDDSAHFAGWPAARAELRATAWAEVTLAVSYRSVPAIGELGRAISSGRPAALPTEPPADPAVWATACPGGFAQAALLCWQLDALMARDPWRQLAVIARTPEHARRLHAELARGLDPVLVLDGDFRFEPGILVTTAAAISGLEFDAVVIPDLSPAFYPPTPELRRALYVAATRARDWLWLLTPESWSPLASSS